MIAIFDDFDVNPDGFGDRECESDIIFLHLTSKHPDSGCLSLTNRQNEVFIVAYQKSFNNSNYFFLSDSKTFTAQLTKQILSRSKISLLQIRFRLSLKIR